MVLNQKIPESEIGQRAYTIMVLNQKIPERKKLATKHTQLWFQTRKYQKEKNLSQSIHYNGSKPKIPET